MKDCIDCRHSHSTGRHGQYKCDKRGKTFDFFAGEHPACSDFIDTKDSSNSCYECTHFSKGFFGGYVCEKTGKKIFEDDKACKYFIDL